MSSRKETFMEKARRLGDPLKQPLNVKEVRGDYGF
jgi:hypothetical protein